MRKARSTSQHHHLPRNQSQRDVPLENVVVEKQRRHVRRCSCRVNVEEHRRALRRVPKDDLLVRGIEEPARQYAAVCVVV